MKQPEWLGLLFAAIGVVGFGVGIALYDRARRLVRTAVHVQGVVIELLKSSSVRTAYVPKVRFETPEGQSFEFTDSIGSNPAQLKPGDTVTVRYPPGRPEDARIAGWLQTWLSQRS